MSVLDFLKESMITMFRQEGLDAPTLQDIRTAADRLSEYGIDIDSDRLLVYNAHQILQMVEDYVDEKLAMKQE